MYNVLAALTIGGAVLLLYTVASARRAEEKPTPTRNWAEIQGGHLLYGSDAAPATMVVFSDFQCPACARMDEWLGRLAAESGNNISISVRNFPLTRIHHSALAAAQAAECAGDEGYYRPYHHALFQHQAELGAVRWDEILAGPAHPDGTLMARCMADTTVMARVMRDIAIGRQAGVEGTPTIILNGQRLPAARSYRELRTAVLRSGQRARGGI